jgi:hypothetical protein
MTEGIPNHFEVIRSLPHGHVMAILETIKKQGKSISITLDKRNSAQPPYSHCPSPRAYFFVADYVGKWIPG